MNMLYRRFVSPAYVVALHHDGKPLGRAQGSQIWTLPYTLTYSVPHPKTTRHVVRTYRVYRTLDEPTAPFILVRGERVYLTPPLTRKVLSS